GAAVHPSATGRGRPCTHPARHKILRGIEKHKEHVPCYKNSHNPLPSARSASISARIEILLLIGLAPGIHQKRACSDEAREYCGKRLRQVPNCESGSAMILNAGRNSDDATKRRSGIILTNSIGYVRLRNAVGSRWCSPRMTRRITMLWC